MSEMTNLVGYITLHAAQSKVDTIFAGIHGCGCGRIRCVCTTAAGEHYSSETRVQSCRVRHDELLIINYTSKSHRFD